MPHPETRTRGGWTILCFDTLRSTNDTAHEMAVSGAPGHTAIVARTQTAGRGRLGRRWLSPSGAPGGGENVYMSLMLRPDMDAEGLGMLVPLFALATARAVNMTTGLDVRLKWPNDLMCSGRKLGGILLESRVKGGTPGYAVAGIGINVNTPADAMPPEVADMATSVMAETGRRHDCDALVDALLDEAGGMLDRLVSADGRSAMMDGFRALSCTLGQRVTVHTASGTTTGVATVIDRSGALVVESDGRRVTVKAGDVTLAPPEGNKPPRGRDRGVSRKGDELVTPDHGQCTGAFNSRPVSGYNDTKGLMLIAADIGNTSVTFGRRAAGGYELMRVSLRPVPRSSAITKALADWLGSGRTAGSSVLCSVNLQATDSVAEALRDATGSYPAMLTHADAAGLMEIDIDEPASLGPDRMAGALGALSMAEPPVCVVDVGTAATVNFLEPGAGGRARYVGGAIIPGPRLMASALAGRTSLLPEAGMPATPVRVPGRNTLDNIQIAMTCGLAGAIERIIAEAEAARGMSYVIILTGGDAGVVRPHLGRSVKYEEALNIIGLMAFHESVRGAAAHKGGA